MVSSCARKRELVDGSLQYLEQDDRRVERSHLGISSFRVVTMSSKQLTMDMMVLQKRDPYLY